MKSFALVLFGLFALAGVACGGGHPGAASGGGGEPGPKAGRLRLGHYSSGDGMVGFVFDRSGPAPKIRLDGSREMLVLESQPTQRDRYFLVNHAEHIGIEVDAEGGVVFSKKSGGTKPVYRDGDGQAL